MTSWTSWAGPLIAIALVLVTNQYGYFVGALCLAAVIVAASHYDRSHPLKRD